MSVQIILNRDIYLDSVVSPVTLTNPIYYGDADAQRIRFRVYQSHGDETPLDLSEATITTHFLRPDDGDVIISGVGGSEYSYVDLPAACYAYSGIFKCLVKVSGNDITTSVLYLTGRIDNPTSDTIVDPGTVIPSLDDLLAQIDACEDATAAANTAATNATNAVSYIADTYSDSAVYAVGDYVIYSGALYKCTTAVTTAGSWATNSSHFTATTVDTEVGALSTEIDLVRDTAGAILGNTIYTDLNYDKWIGTSSPVNVTTLETYAGAACIAIPCVAGDVFTITGRGYTSTHRLWVFINSSGTIITKAESNATADNVVLTAPSSAAYLVVNFNTNYPYNLFSGKNVESAFFGEYRYVSNVTEDNSGSENYSSLSYSFYPGYHARENMIIHIKLTWTGTDPAKCFYRRLVPSLGDSTRSQLLPLGQTPGQMREMAFRVPRFQNSQIAANIPLVFYITVPAGTCLTIKELYNTFEKSASRAEDCGVNLCAHNHLEGDYPFCTMAMFKAAADLGYRYLITIPKVTNDGVLVCFHDDGSISDYARNDDGTAIDSQYDLPVSSLSYATLMTFDFGIYCGSDFAGERIPKLEDFFRVCATTGMHPMLSVHPSLDGYWDEIKALAEKFGLLDKLNIKGGSSYLSYPMAVLLNGVESYTLDYSTITAAQAVTAFNTMLTNNNIDRTKVRCIIEDMSSNAFVQADVTTILNAGFEVGKANYARASAELTDTINMGVTWFTDDHTPHVGLTWM